MGSKWEVEGRNAASTAPVVARSAHSPPLSNDANAPESALFSPSNGQDPDECMSPFSPTWNVGIAPSTDFGGGYRKLAQESRQ